MNDTLLIPSLEKLSRYSVAEGYQGYSLYDSHTSPIPFHRFGNVLSFYINQVIKRSPLNLRPVFGIPKDFNPKGVGLFLNAISDVIESDLPVSLALVNGTIREEARMLFNWLLENQSRGYSGMCWGYNYPWPKRDVGLVPSYTPSSVVTGFNSRAIFNYYRISSDDAAREALRSSADFILNDIPRTETSSGTCFSYLPIKEDQTVNANLLAAEVLVYADHVNRTTEHEGLVRDVLKYTVNVQNPDGSWYYSFNMKGGAPKKQIDFHQGYVLESIFRICRWSGIDFAEYTEVVKRGLTFYREAQFDDQGKAYWRLPAKWPMDIHNQSQGIITFCTFSFLIPEYLKFACTIAEQTIRTMQGSRGNFYYQRWPFLTNRVSYMRWNQAWMYNALVKAVATLRSQSASLPAGP